MKDLKKIIYSKNFALFFYLLFFSLSIYLFEFHLLVNSFDYFWCVDVKKDFSLPLFQNIKLPIHCDEGPYFSASTDIQYFFSNNNPYQKRPLWILLIASINFLLESFFSSHITEYQIIRISFFFSQLILLFTVSKLFIIYLGLKLNKLSEYLPLTALLLFPNIRWNILFPSHENLTILAMVMSLLVLSSKNKSLLENNGTYIIFGVLVLAHRSFLIYGFLIIFYQFFLKKKIKIFAKNFLFLISPYIAFEILLATASLESYDWNKSNFKQFYWIFDVIRGKETFNSNNFCQTFKTFYKCNFEITYNYLKYFIIMLMFVVLLLAFINTSNRNYEFELKNLVYLTIGIYLFWSLQGWYPPYRFINYSLGYFMVMLFMTCVESLKIKKNIAYLSLIFYFMSVGYLEPYSKNSLELNFFNLISLLLFVFYLFNMYKSKTVYRD